MTSRRGLPLVLAAALLLATACTRTPPAEQDPPEHALTVLVDAETARGIEPLLPDFTAATGVEVALEVVDRARIPATFVAEAADGDAPDLVLASHDWLADFVGRGLIAPLPAQIDDAGLADLAASATRLEGEQYAVAMSVDSVALLRNTALVPQPPASWEELVTTATAAGTSHAVVLPADGQRVDPTVLYPIQSSFGSALREPGASEAGELLARGGGEFAAFLSANGPLGSGLLTTQVPRSGVVEAMAQGEVPYVVGDPRLARSIAEAGVPLATSPVPSAGGQEAAGFLVIYGLFLSAESDQVAQARGLLELLAQRDPQYAIYRETGIPPAQMEARSRAEQDAVAADLMLAAEGGHLLPGVAWMAPVWTPLGNVEKALLDGIVSDPEAAWKQLVRDVSGNWPQ